MNTHTTVATDAFTRANASTLGANWTNGVGGVSPGVLSNQAKNQTGSADNGAFYSASSFANDQYSEATLVQYNTGGDDFSGVTVRTSTTDHVIFQVNLGAGKVDLVWYHAGAYDLLDSDGGATGDPTGKRFTLEVVGQHFYGYLDGTLVVDATAASAPSTGKPGIMLSGTNAAASLMDTWEGGDIPSAVTVHHLGLLGIGA